MTWMFHSLAGPTILYAVDDHVAPLPDFEDDIDAGRPQQIDPLHGFVGWSPALPSRDYISTGNLLIRSDSETIFSTTSTFDMASILQLCPAVVNSNRLGEARPRQRGNLESTDKFDGTHISAAISIIFATWPERRHLT